jgi:hypothetical protein
MRNTQGGRLSAEAIVVDGLKTNYEGLNFRRIVVNESY